MASEKKSFVLYCDVQHTVKKLNNEQAGKLFKHLLSYVNDENPEAEDILTEIAFEPIKQQLKRDLQKWSGIKESRSDAGKASAEKRRIQKEKATNPTSVESVEQPSTNPTVNVNVNVNDTVNVINKTKCLLSEIDISDVESGLQDFFEIAKAFQNLFIKNLEEKNSPVHNQKKATFKNYVDPIRLMLTTDGVTHDQLKEVFKYLDGPDSEFWKSNILSTKKLREQFSKLSMQANQIKTNGNRNSNTPVFKINRQTVDTIKNNANGW